MKKINLVVNSKGGVGKSTISLILCQLLAYRGIEFKYIEIDNSNDTTQSLSNSEVFKDRTISIKTASAQEELFKATFEAVKENKIVVIDVGGGTDTNELISLIKEQFSHLENEINYILPFENSYKQIGNLIDTYSLIAAPENIFLIKNKVIKYADRKDPYIFFEGDEKLGIKSIRKELKQKNKVFEVCFSEQNQISEITEESMLDVATLALQYSSSEAHNLFMQKDDMQEYLKGMTRYANSKKSLDEILVLNDEFEELIK